MINKKLIKYDKQAQFDKDIAGTGPNKISPNSIVFIVENGRIYTQNRYFGGTWEDISSKPETFAPAAHKHGSITNDGKIGTLDNRIIETTTGGALTHVAKKTAYNKAFGTESGTVAQGNDSRINNGQSAFTRTTNAGITGAYLSNITELDTPPVGARFISSTPSTHSSYPAGMSYPMGIEVGRSAAVSAQLVIGHSNSGTNGNMAFRSKSGASMAPWRSVWDNVNLTKLTQLTNDLPNFNRTVAGLVPAPGAATTTRYLREDGSWFVPPNTGDTHWTTGIRAGASETNANSVANDPFIKVLDNTTYRSQVQILGGTNITAKSDATGKITIDGAHNHDTVYVKKIGDTMTGKLTVLGTAASQSLQVRGVVGSNATGSAVDSLYLQYGANKPVMFGNTGAYNISADGSSYSGTAANATNAANASKLGNVALGGLFTTLAKTTDNKLSITIGGTNKTLALGSNAFDSTAYLPLSGGTITNSASINKTSNSFTETPMLHFSNMRAQIAGVPIIRMTNSEQDKGFGILNNGALGFGNWSHVSSMSSSWDTVYHTGNIPTWNQSTTGNASTASAVSTSAENSNATSRYILFADKASGNQALKTDSGLKYVSSTNTISANFAGNLTGLASLNLPLTGGALSNSQSYLSGNSFTGILDIVNTSTGTSGEEIGPHISFRGNRGASDTGTYAVYGAIGAINTAPSGTSGGALVFLTKNANGSAQTPTEQMRIATGGNVGIGTTSPAYKLDVSGTGRFTGNVTAPTFVGALTGLASLNLPLTGGTLTGSTYNMLELKRSSAAGSSILFSNSTTSLGKIGFTSNGNLIIGTGASTDGVANMLSITPSGVAQFYGNISTSGLVTGTGFSKTGATDAHVLLGSGGHKAISDFNTSLVTSTTKTGTTNVATSNTNTYLNLIQGTSVVSSTQIMGSNGVSVSSNTSGRVTIAGVGDFRDYGLGSGTSVNKNPDDFGSMSSGLYGVSTVAVGNPVSGSSGTLIHLRSPASGNNYWAQLHLLANGTTSAKAFISHGQTTRVAKWEELYHTGNLNPVTTNTAQNISGTKTFDTLRSKKVTLMHPSTTNAERGIFEYMNGTSGWGIHLDMAVSGYGVMIGGTADYIHLNSPVKSGNIDAGNSTITAATFSGNASSATRVNNKLILKFDTGTTENTNLYTYDGSAAKTIDIKAGSNVSLSKTANTVTINATNTNTYVTQNNTTTTSYRPFLLGYNTAAISANFGNTTNLSYYANTLRVQPSTGNIISNGSVTASSFVGNLTGLASLNLPLTGGRLTTGTGDVNIELWRGTNASWNILNSGGYLRFQSNYTTVAGTYFDALKLDYNTGNALFKGTVTAPTFSGSLSGTATNATNINTLADNSSNASRFILFSDAATGNQRAKTDSGLKYNPSTNTITATLAGNASSATNISNSGTVTLATATESNSITITQPSYVSGKPVKLLNFNWYATTWSLGNIRGGSTDTQGLGIYLGGVEKFRFSDGSLKVGSNTVYHSGNLKPVTLDTTQTISGAKTFSSKVKILGSAAAQPLQVRGIVGDNSTGTIDDLYLQYGANKIIFLGNTAAHSISADGSKYTGDAATVGGLAVNPVANTTANRLVRTNASGYIQAGWINTASGTATGTLTRIYCSQDAYLRYLTPANFISSLNLASLASPTFTGTVTAPAFKGSIMTTGVEYLSTLNTTITAAGWYRVFVSNISNGGGSSVILNVNRNYSNSNNESYTFSINVAYSGAISITQLSGRAQTRIISKIRVDYVNSGVLAVDIYYSSAIRNTVYISGSGTGKFQAPALIAAPTGTTVEFDTVNGVKSNLGFTGDLTGNATTATALTTNAGSKTQPIYFSGGKPVATSHSLGKSVPSTAVFTDTHWTSGIRVGASGTAANTAVTSPYIKVVDDTSYREQFRLIGGTNITVSSDANKNITISGTAASSNDVKQSIASSSVFRPVLFANTTGSNGPGSSYNHTTITGETHYSTGLRVNMSNGDMISSGKINSSGFYQTSDIRLKNVIRNMSISRQDIESIPTFYFKYKNSDRLDIGTSAQEVQKIFPELVDKNPTNGILTIQYDKFGIIALEMIKSQFKELDNLRKEVELLKSRCNGK